MCVPIQILSEIFLILRRIQQNIVINVKTYYLRKEPVVIAGF
jgi:hypothetical protein